jgi:hypothetical protein
MKHEKRKEIMNRKLNKFLAVTMAVLSLGMQIVSAEPPDPEPPIIITDVSAEPPKPEPPIFTDASAKPPEPESPIFTDDSYDWDNYDWDNLEEPPEPESPIFTDDSSNPDPSKYVRMFVGKPV